MNGKGSARRPESKEQYQKFLDEHERIFKKPMEVEILEDFLEDDLENAQVDLEDFIHDRKRNES